jgi:site-specific DNA recombinase
MGDYYFNVYDSKAKVKRPPSEWVKTSIPPIIDAKVFELVRSKRALRAPDQTPARITSSPNLLTGILKCGVCGGGMTQTTGKSGTYKYYKCTSRQNKGNQACTSKNLPMEKTDDQVLHQLADKVFSPARVQSMMVALRKRIKSSKDTQQSRVNELNKQIKLIEDRQGRLLEAIETGVIDLDETVQRRAQQNKSAREALLIEVASVRRDRSSSIDQIKASDVDAFAKTLKAKLLAKDSALAKSYLTMLVDEIVVTDNTATVKGSYGALNNAFSMGDKKVGHLKQVPTSISNWYARRDSNS